MLRFLPCAACLAVLTAALPPARGANDPLDTKPHISLAFPLADAPEGVSVSCPVIINSTTVLTPNDILRIIYVPLSAEDARVVQEQRLDQKEVAYTRLHQLEAMETEESQLSPEARALLKMIRETHWDNQKMFQLALANQPGADLRVVTADRQSAELRDSAIALPDGLLLGAEGGVIKVLAVEVGSRGESAGLRANDIILQVADQRMGDDLVAYLKAHATAKRAAEMSSGRQFKMIAQNIEENAPREVIFQLPPSLSTGFMDQPIDLSTDTKKESVPAMPSADEPWRKKKN